MTNLPQPRLDPTPGERYETLLRVAQNLAAKRNPRDLIQVLASELRRLLNFDYLSLFLSRAPSPGTGWYALDTAESGLVPLSAVPPEAMLSTWVFETQQSASVPSGTATHCPLPAEFLTQRDLRCVCSVPLTALHRRLGSLTVASKQAAAYPEQQVRFLSLIAEQVALAIDGAMNFEGLQLAQAESERRSERLKLILDVNNSIAANLELQDLLRSISASVRQVLHCDAAAVTLVDTEARQLRVYALDFPESKGFVKEGFLIPIEGSALGDVIRTGKPLVRTTPVTGDPGAVVARAEGLKYGCLCPLISRDRTLGVLSVARRGENTFTQDDVDFLAQVACQVAIALDNAMAYSQIADLKDQLAQEKLYLEGEIRSELNFEEIVGRSAPLRRVLKQVETVAPTDTSVVIYGETGTGKELIARAIHDLSSRRANTFVKLNCAAIPTGLLESELFGHEKGAFTGAISLRIGRFELANRGTVFLDEIGEIPLEVQPKLLRVLQEREFERLGSSRTLRTDARLIVASNRDLADMVEEQRFRADLFYRLNVFPIHVPSLRERPEDVPLLVRHFVQQFARRMNKTIETIPAETMTALTRYPWPGNIRELQNLVERAMILSTGPVLRVPLADLHIRAAHVMEKPQTLEEAERGHILAALKETSWTLAGPRGAAKRLGMNRSTLQFRMKKLGIRRPGR